MKLAWFGNQFHPAVVESQVVGVQFETYGARLARLQERAVTIGYALGNYLAPLTGQLARIAAGQ